MRQDHRPPAAPQRPDDAKYVGTYRQNEHILERLSDGLRLGYYPSKHGGFYLRKVPSPHSLSAIYTDNGFSEFDDRVHRYRFERIDSSTVEIVALYALADRRKRRKTG